MVSGLAPHDTRLQNQAEIDQYIGYVRFVVSHFKDRIHYYEIWNELGGMEITDYANLIRQVAPVIRQEHFR
jgi:beta-glucosidase/6-phospho-beta-glucosidase/beta-galactosidase